MEILAAFFILVPAIFLLSAFMQNLRQRLENSTFAISVPSICRCVEDFLWNHRDVQLPIKAGLQCFPDQHFEMFYPLRKSTDTFATITPLIGTEMVQCDISHRSLNFSFISVKPP
jgi:hypothetical protein